MAGRYLGDAAPWIQQMAQNPPPGLLALSALCAAFQLTRPRTCSARRQKATLETRRAAHRSPECCEVAAWLRWLARLRPPALRAAAEPPRERTAVERPDADAAKRT